jgi:hypothetical protein
MLTRTRRLLPVATGLALCAVTLGISAGANAQPPYPPDDPPPTNPPSIPDCKRSDGSWATQPRVVVHTKEYQGATPKSSAVAAISDVDRQIGATGGHGAEVTSTTEWPLTDFHYGETYGDIYSTIHVGFVDDLPEPAGSTGTTLAATDPYIPNGPCEVHIAIVETGNSWNYGTPLRNGPAGTGQHLYYEAGRSDPNGVDYLRISYLHELLHAFGLDHTATGFAFENYGERPWMRAPSSDAVRPLPDDIEHLRDLYPSSETYTNVAVLNTWYDPDDVSSTGAARQGLLCKPSTGTANADRWDDPNKGDLLSTCGKTGTAAGSTSICSNSTLRTRVAFTNSSSEAVDVTVRYWLSTDDTWDSGDHLSPTQPAAVEVSRTGSRLLSDSWTVPNLGTTAATSTASNVAKSGSASAPSGSVTAVAGPSEAQSSTSISYTTSYYVIARVEATTEGGVTTRDWIPLRGRVSYNRLTCAS